MFIMKEFDESEAVAAMRCSLSAADQNKYKDDELLNLIDIIWDFYEQNGLLDVDIDDDDDDDEAIMSELVDYAVRMIKKDRYATLDPNLIEPLVKAEIAYENSLLDEQM